MFTVKEVAKRLKISEAEVYKLCSAKQMSHLRIGTGRGTIRVREEDLEDFIRRSLVQPRQSAAPKPSPMKFKHLKA
jgi:excisionase family DNA binding protein